jgi:hypothetical protein
MGFTEHQKEQLLRMFLDMPSTSYPSHQSSAVLVTSEIPKLGIDFSKDDVDVFIKWSDTLSDIDMSLDKILDKYAIFTMTTKFELLESNLVFQKINLQTGYISGLILS